MNPTPARHARVTSSLLRPALSPLERTQHTILAALQGKPDGAIYGGTVPPKEKARRRAANKAARIARRAGRG
jgi:hypothetical protein